MAADLNWFGLLRTYSFRTVDNDLFQPLPPEIEVWVDTRVRQQMRFKQLLPIQVTFGATELELQRAILLNTSSRYADVLLYSNASRLPVDLFLNTWNFINNEAFFNYQDNVTPLRRLWDDAVREVVNEADVPFLEGTAFGSISLSNNGANEDEFEGDLQNEIHISDSLNLTGVHHGETVSIERNSLIILANQLENERAQSPWGYVLLAGLFSRNRLISDQIINRATEVSSEINDQASRRTAEHVLRRSAEVQQFGIQSRAWAQGASYLGNPHLVAIFNKAGGLAALGELERENQLAALEGLDRFANGLSGAMTARSQRRLNSVGFAVAILSLLLSGINVTYLATAKSEPRMWVFGTWVLTLFFISGSLTFTVWFSRRWTRPRSSPQSG